MPLVVTALDAALDLPAPGAGGAEPPPTVLGRALKRVGAVADADARNVSRAQIEVRLVSDHLGAGCRVTAVGENPTPWFPSGREGLAGSEDGTSEPSKRLLRKGESAVLRDGDGLGLCQTDAPPGALRFQSARAARTLGPETLFDVDTRNTKLAFTPPGRSTDRATPFTDGAGRDADADAIDSRDEKNENENDETEKDKDDSKVSEALFVETSARGAKRARDEGEDPTTTDHANVIEPFTLPLKYGFRRPIVLVLSGAPGSGKSTFCASLPRDTWTVVNQDTAGKNGKPGTRAKCVQLVRGALNKGHNVAVDRCGLTLEQRQDFVRLARERGALAHALWLDPPRELLFERLRNRTNHPTVKNGAGVAVCKRMLGAKANAPPTKKEGFERVTRCANEWDVERALAGYRRITDVASDGVGVGDGDAEFPKADGAAATPAKPQSSPNAFAVMMGAAKASAKTTPRSAKKEKHTNASASASNPEKGGGSWRDALSAMAADPATHAERGAVVFFDDELVVAKDAYPKSRTHLLVLARDTRLAEGPKALRSSDAPLVRRMMRAGLECARKLVGNSSETAEDDFENRFRCGFHASPSMRTAHMHVVSLDLRGSGMKTRRHWNSFATSFLKEAEETAIDLEKGNERLDWDVAELERVVAMTPLRCHKCGDGPFNTMPKLFAHCDACESEGFSVRTDSSL